MESVASTSSQYHRGSHSRDVVQRRQSLDELVLRALAVQVRSHVGPQVGPEVGPYVAVERAQVGERGLRGGLLDVRVHVHLAVRVGGAVGGGVVAGRGVVAGVGHVGAVHGPQDGELPLLLVLLLEAGPLLGVGGVLFLLVPRRPPLGAVLGVVSPLPGVAELDVVGVAVVQLVYGHVGRALLGALVLFTGFRFLLDGLENVGGFGGGGEGDLFNVFGDFKFDVFLGVFVLFGGTRLVRRALVVRGEMPAQVPADPECLPAGGALVGAVPRVGAHVAEPVGGGAEGLVAVVARVVPLARVDAPVHVQRVLAGKVFTAELTFE